MKAAIFYAPHNTWLMPGSDAHKLHQEGQQQKLKEHMTRLAKEAHERGDVPYAAGGILRDDQLAMFGTFSAKNVKEAFVPLTKLAPLGGFKRGEITIIGPALRRAQGKSMLSVADKTIFLSLEVDSEGVSQVVLTAAKPRAGQ